MKLNLYIKLFSNYQAIRYLHCLKSHNFLCSRSLRLCAMAYSWVRHYVLFSHCPFRCLFHANVSSPVRRWQQAGHWSATLVGVIWQFKLVHLVQSSGPVSTVPGYVVYNQTRDVSGQSLFSWPTCMLAFSTSLSAPIRQQPVHLTWVGQGTPVMWFSQLP